MIDKREKILLIVLVSRFFNGIFGWDTEELELFDLVEEVNQNFYDVLGITQDFNNADLRKAYRKLSLQLHPDKNKKEDAEEKFRQLVAIYEVLKDYEKRRIYDNILLNGLPTWRQPVYYYRHVRKMSLLELAIFLFLLATGAQYLFAWSVYIEKKYELEEILTAKFKKKEKKAKKMKIDIGSNDAFLAQLDMLPKPKYQDLLPFKLCTFLIYLLKSTPGCYQKWRELWLQVRMDDANSSDQESEGDDNEERQKKPRRKKVFELPDMSSECILDSVDAPEEENSTHHTENINKHNCENSNPWTDEQLVSLIRLINKFPGGVTNRWEKIAAALGRSVSDVISASKQLKLKTLESGASMPTSVQGITGSLEENHQSKRSVFNDNSKQQKPFRTSKEMNQSQPFDHPVPVISVTGAETPWDQIQQKALELALTQFPKGTEERWDRIANCVPGKTKDDCIMRYKELVELVKKKRQLTSR